MRPAKRQQQASKLSCTCIDRSHATLYLGTVWKQSSKYSNECHKACKWQHIFASTNSTLGWMRIQERQAIVERQCVWKWQMQLGIWNWEVEMESMVALYLSVKRHLSATYSSTYPQTDVVLFGNLDHLAVDGGGFTTVFLFLTL